MSEAKPLQLTDLTITTNAGNNTLTVGRPTSGEAVRPTPANILAQITQRIPAAGRPALLQNPEDLEEFNSLLDAGDSRVFGLLKDGVVTYSRSGDMTFALGDLYGSWAQNWQNDGGTLNQMQEAASATKVTDRLREAETALGSLGLGVDVNEAVEVGRDGTLRATRGFWETATSQTRATLADANVFGPAADLSGSEKKPGGRLSNLSDDAFVALLVGATTIGFSALSFAMQLKMREDMLKLQVSEKEKDREHDINMLERRIEGSGGGGGSSGGAGVTRTEQVRYR